MVTLTATLAGVLYIVGAAMVAWGLVMARARKVGGMRFWRVGRVGGSLYIAQGGQS